MAISEEELQKRLLTLASDSYRDGACEALGVVETALLGIQEHMPHKKIPVELVFDIIQGAHQNFSTGEQHENAHKNVRKDRRKTDQ